MALDEEIPITIDDIIFAIGFMDDLEEYYHFMELSGPERLDKVRGILSRVRPMPNN